jgi:ATP/maltotriose-dependent transcriptional regulator MalT
MSGQGWVPSEPATAPEVLTRAREALAVHAWQEGHDLAAGLQFEDPRADADRLDVLAEAAWWLGRLDDCIDARETAYRAYESLDDLRRAGQCAVWLYEHNNMRARPAIASAWLRRARRALEGDPECVEHGALLLREAEMAHGGGQLEDAAALAERAHQLGRRLTSPDLEAEALQTMGRVLIDAGQPKLGLEHLDEAMLLAVEGRLGPYSTGKVYCSLIGACEDLGDMRRAAEWTEATDRWAQKHPFAIFPGICRVHRAVVLNWGGALVDAEREATQACAELLASHVPNAAAGFAEMGDIRRRLGDLERAEEAFARAEELSGRTCAGSALLRLAQGRIDAAARIISDCIADGSPNRLARARLLPVATQIAVAGGDLVAAETSVRELEAIAEVFDTAMLRAMAALSRGRVQLAAQDPAACATLREAVRLWQELAVPFEVATAQTVLAQALRDAGDEPGARESFAAARALFDQIGVRLDEGADRGDQRRLPAGLTGREAEVLQLVASGLSNKDIAAALHLSAKTVSRHLSNIFTKIGVSSRAAATAFAFEHRLAGGRD